MIIAANSGGLANRMRCIASCYKFSEDKTLTTGVVWKVLDDYRRDNHILNCPFSLLFENKIEYDSKKEVFGPLYEYKSHCLLIEDVDNIPDNFNTFKSNCTVKFIKNDGRGRNIDFMYSKIPGNIRDKFINAFRMLRPHSELKEIIDSFSRENFDDDTISVHIRSWNRNAESSRRDYLHDLKKYEREMRLCSPHSRFFISSDSSEVLRYFRESEEWGKRVIFFDRKTDLDSSRDHPGGVREDLIELYLLSKNRSLIGSHFSTFSEVAWWLGECMDVVIV